MTKRDRETLERARHILFVESDKARDAGDDVKSDALWDICYELKLALYEQDYQAIRMLHKF